MIHPAPTASAAKPARRVALLVVLIALGLAVLFFTARGVQVSLDDLLGFKAYSVPHYLRLPLLGLLLATVWGNLRSTGSSSGLWTRLCRSRNAFGILLVLTLICFRWNMLPGFEMDPDESQSIIAARTLTYDSRFWVSVDVGTHGPLVALWQTLLPRVGLAIDYASSRLLGVLLLIGALWASFHVLRRVANEAGARSLLLPPALIVATINTEGAAAYNGEHPITFLALLALGFGIAAILPACDAMEGEAAVPTARALRLLMASGLCLGAVPWAKVQGVPIAVAVWAVIAYGCLTDPVGPAPGRWLQPARLRRLIVFSVGALLPTLAVLIWVVANGATTLMLRSYFEWNLAYAARYKNEAGAQAALSALWIVQSFLKMSWVGLWFAPAGLLGAGLVLRTPRRGTRANFLLGSVCVVALASWFAAIKPGNRYDHYAVLPLLPTLLFGVLCWAVILNQSRAASQGPNPVVQNLLSMRIFAVAGVLFPLVLGTMIPNLGNRSGQAWEAFRVKPPKQALTPARVSSLVRPGQPMVVWGWLPSLYVLTGAHAPRSSASLREAFRGYPMQEYFLRLYIEDFDHLNPVVFVDDVRPYSSLIFQYNLIARRDPALKAQARPRFVHEDYPELNERIRTRYRLYETDLWGVRIYLRRDLWQSRVEANTISRGRRPQ